MDAVKLSKRWERDGLNRQEQAVLATRGTGSYDHMPVDIQIAASEMTGYFYARAICAPDCELCAAGWYADPCGYCGADATHVVNGVCTVCGAEDE